LSRLYYYLGELKSATNAARKGIKAAKSSRADNKKMTRHLINSTCLLAWALSLRGFTCASNELFQKARILSEEIGDGRILKNFCGAFNAEHLILMGNLQEARDIAEINFASSQELKRLSQVSRFHRILGNIDSIEGKNALAEEHYLNSLRIARDIYRKDLIIETLLSLGRFRAKNIYCIKEAFCNLNDALEYSKSSSYRIFEVDVRLGLSFALLSIDDLRASENEAIYAWKISRNIGYYWGDVEAMKIFSLIQNKKEISAQRIPKNPPKTP
jgi:tetratricopeptide (TPR) repeat protein